MSKTSMKERNKAIRIAWEKEQALVQEGKGTRDWTAEQQRDILDPNKGKAYDDQGRAFVGHHMKSSAAYPAYQGDPNNIQFLTYEEHLEAAHKGSWRNSTNGYYDPVTKEYTDFGDNAPTPCSIIELSDPVVVPKLTEPKEVVEKEQSAQNENSDKGTHTSEKSTDNAPPKSKVKSASSAFNDKLEKSYTERTGINTAKSTTATKIPGAAKVPKTENGFIKGLKNVGKFIVNHPVESLEIAGVVIGGTVEIVSAVSGSRSKNSGTSTSSSGNGATPVVKTDIATKVADIVEKSTREERSSPKKHIVPGHGQHYNTKDGVIWKEKDPYPRGGKHNDE